MRKEEKGEETKMKKLQVLNLNIDFLNLNDYVLLW